MDALEHNEDPSSSWSSDESCDEHAYPLMHTLVRQLACDSMEWRPPWPPARLWYRVPWCVRVYATQARSCSLIRIHGYSILHRFDPHQDNMCCTEYAHTIGTNCWRALAQVQLTAFQATRLHLPATVPHRCTGAFRHTGPMGQWELTHSQWCDATSPCARNLPLCLPDTTDWPVVELPVVLRPYRKAPRPAALAAPNASVQGPPETAHVNSTTALVALPASLTSVGRQAPWSGAALAAPPWALVLPAPTSPVTSQAVTNDVRRTQLHELVVTTVSLIRESRTLDADTARWAYAMLRLSLFRLWHSRATAHFAHPRWRSSRNGRSGGRR